MFFLLKCLQPDFGNMVDLLTREATRKISSVFAPLLLAENSSLKARVGRLESELKAVTESLENSNLWRENVLSGCPVLFQDSGLIFTLKPLGKLSMKPKEGEDDPPPAAEQDRREDQPEQALTESRCSFCTFQKTLDENISFISSYYRKYNFNPEKKMLFSSSFDPSAQNITLSRTLAAFFKFF